MTQLHRFDVHYTFEGEPRHHAFELPVEELPVHEAAMHVLQLHFGDAENSLLMPSEDATAEEILAKAKNLGIKFDSDVVITRADRADRGVAQR